MATEKTEAEGCRVICDGQYGTVKFFGEVPPASGVWYGIEWDEDGRGKHSGEHEGIKYFDCSRAGCGSFVRPKKLDFGVSVVEALVQKFNDLHRQEESDALDFFYYVGRDEKHDVEEKLKRLKHVNLRWTNVSRCDKQWSLGNVAPNIVELDLSKTLLSEWQEVVEIIKDLHLMAKLDLSQTRLRFGAPDKSVNLLNDVPLKTLIVNKVNLNWQQVIAMSSMFVELEELHASFNNMQNLIGGNLSNLKKLCKLNLEGNDLSDWNEVLLLKELPVLETLVLNNNNFTTISFPGSFSEMPDVFLRLKSLSLSETAISDWSSINQLNRLPALEMLAIKDCPVVKGIADYEARQELIAHIGKCSKLNQSQVTVKERQAAERAYLKKYGKEWLGSGGNLENAQSTVDVGFITNHPRYLPLLKEHGVPENLGASSSTGSTLKDNLVVVTITCLNDIEQHTITKKLPSAMTVSKLKGLLHRLFKVLPVNQSLSYVDQTGHKIEMNDDLRPLSFYSVQSGNTIYLKC